MFKVPSEIQRGLWLFLHLLWRNVGGKVLFLLFFLERAWRENQNPHKIHLHCPSLLAVPPGAATSLPQCWRALMGLIHRKHSLNASGGVPTLLMLYCPFLVTIPPMVPSHTSSYFHPKETHPGQEEPIPGDGGMVAPQGRHMEAVSVSSIFKSCNLLQQRAGDQPHMVLSSSSHTMDRY